jgi:hypothetical protein
VNDGRIFETVFNSEIVSCEVRGIVYLSKIQYAAHCISCFMHITRHITYMYNLNLYFNAYIHSHVVQLVEINF